MFVVDPRVSQSIAAILVKRRWATDPGARSDYFDSKMTFQGSRTVTQELLDFPLGNRQSLREVILESFYH